jgi:hypothetical protein
MAAFALDVFSIDFQVLHVGFVCDVKDVPHDRDAADQRVDPNIHDHSHNRVARQSSSSGGHDDHAGDCRTDEIAETKDSNFIAPSKAWERGNPCERMKPFERIQLVKVQSG